MSELRPLGYLPLSLAIQRAQSVWFAALENAYAMTPEESALITAHTAAVREMQEFNRPRLVRFDGEIDGATIDNAIETPLIAALRERSQCYAALRPPTWQHLRALLFGEHLRAYGLVAGVGWKSVAHGQWAGKNTDTPPAKVKVFIGTMPFEAQPFVKEDELEAVLAAGLKPADLPPVIVSAFTVTPQPPVATGEVDVYGSPPGLKSVLGRAPSDAIAAPGAFAAHARFWQGRGRQEWPADRPGHIFLGQAFYALGPARFGADWAGTEPYAPAPADLVGRSQSPDGLKAARGEHAKQSQAAAQRAQAVRLEIARECEAGRLLAACERPGSGDLVPIPREHWSNPVVTLSRLFWCQMNPDMPFGAIVGGRGFGYIFIERSGLERLLGQDAATLLPPLVQPSEAPAPVVQTSTVADERRAEAFLADWLKSNPDATRGQAEAATKAAGLTVSDIGFKSRVWPKAREAAGLSRRGKPGPRKG